VNPTGSIGQLLAGAKPRGRVGFCLMPPVDARLRSRLRSAVGGDRMLVPGLFFCLLLSVDRSPIPGFGRKKKATSR